MDNDKYVVKQCLCEMCDNTECPVRAIGMTCPDKEMYEAYMHYFEQRFACDPVNPNNTGGFANE